MRPRAGLVVACIAAVILSLYSLRRALMSLSQRGRRLSAKSPKSGCHLVGFLLPPRKNSMLERPAISL